MGAEGDRVIYLEIVESRRATRLAARRGDRAPLEGSRLQAAISLGAPAHRLARSHVVEVAGALKDMADTLVGDLRVI
ncbi:MAG TPA: hypothetical protein VFA45_18525 [Actinomycetes bacterium]|jgi:DNA-binding IclR family transcriptional regulator|nr:hypothetical protein [Actinomycetes bacterium]